jgi:hypothetical protein
MRLQGENSKLPRPAYIAADLHADCKQAAAELHLGATHLRLLPWSAPPKSLLARIHGYGATMKGMLCWSQSYYTYAAVVGLAMRDGLMTETHPRKSPVAID